MRVRLGIAVSVAAALVAGCSPGDHGPEQPRLSEAWRVPTITPIGQPVAAGEVLIVYGTLNGDLFLYGVAVSDGAVKWRQRATPSRTLPGTSLTPRVFDTRVAYFRPDSSAELAARLVVGSSATGEDVFVSGPAVYGSQPTTCDDGKDICLSVLTSGPSMSRRFTLGAPGAPIAPVTDSGAPPPDSRYVGDNLLDLGGRNPEVLAGFSDGAVRWRSPLAQHFSPGHTTDLGWYFVLYGSVGQYVGSVGYPADRRDPSVAVADLSKRETAGIDASTGMSTWKAPATDFLCNAKLALYHRVDGDRSKPWPVRCRLRGKARYPLPSGAPKFDNVNVTVEGFDILTGATTWSVDLGLGTWFLTDAGTATVLSDREVLVPGQSGPLIIDLAGGATRMPAPDETFWCKRNADFEYKEGFRLPDGSIHSTWRGGTISSPCTADGAATTLLPRTIAPSVGATIGTRTVIADGNGLVAYDRKGG